MASLEIHFKHNILTIARILCVSLGIILPLCCGYSDDEGRIIMFKEPVENMAMKNHVIRTELVANEGTCRVLCYMEPNCVSINLGPLDGGKYKCELNNATDENQFINFLANVPTYTYLAIENPCSSSPCLNNGTCQAGFTSKGFRCICGAEFTGTECRQDIDECRNGSHDCDVNANCTNTVGGHYCTCKEGFTGDGRSCSDIDECRNGSHNCDVNATDCTNTVGGHNCVCKEGFTGDGRSCSDIDECSNGSHDCDVNANCTNTVGGHNCTCKEGYTGDGRFCSAYKKNCAEIFKSGERTDGVYTIKPDNLPAFDVFCDQTTDGGGWAVFQKRLDGTVDFYLNWTDYKQGFGDLSAEFWLGNKKIHRLTSGDKNRLRIDLEDFEGNTAYAEYDMFGVLSENDKYKLMLGFYSGNATDSLFWHRDLPFTTSDQDNDNNENSNCAMLYHGAWWYNACHASNLNGIYRNSNPCPYGDGVMWVHWKGHDYSLKRTEMKIRPVDF